MLSAEVLQLTYGTDSAIAPSGTGRQNHHDALHSSDGGTVVGNLSAADRELAAEIAQVEPVVRLRLLFNHLKYYSLSLC